jgi:hypothetical protein
MSHSVQSTLQKNTGNRKQHFGFCPQINQEAQESCIQPSDEQSPQGTWRHIKRHS